MADKGGLSSGRVISMQALEGGVHQYWHGKLEYVIVGARQWGHEKHHMCETWRTDCLLALTNDKRRPRKMSPLMCFARVALGW